MIEPVYCGVCGLPPEYCSTGSSSKQKKCYRWLKDSHPDLYELYCTKEKNEKGVEDKVDLEESVDLEKKEKEKHVTFSNLKIKEKPKIVVISKSKRNPRKYSTCLSGLSFYESDLKKAAKMLGKRFACGTSVIKNTDPLEVDIQGDVSYDLPQYLVNTFNVPEGVIFLSDKKGKTPAFESTESFTVGNEDDEEKFDFNIL